MGQTVSHGTAGLTYHAQFVKMLKFKYSEKATKFGEIFTLLLTVCTAVKSKVKNSQKDLRQKMTPLKIRDVLIKSLVLSPENGPQ